MKVLYISPQHISGTLPLLCEGHRRRGNEARYVTLFPSAFGFPEDLALRLHLHPDRNFIIKGRNLFLKSRGVDPDREIEGYPPMWRPGGFPERTFFRLRDFLNRRRILSFIEKQGLDDYDIYHLEQGMGFFRDSRVVKLWAEKGKKIVCFYHGNDVRNHGILPDIHAISQLNLTSELDLLDKYPGIKYLFLPIDTDEVKPVPNTNEKLKIVHATRSRYNKGSDFIIETVQELEKKYPVELVLIEHMPHDRCMKIKAECDICIDQIADKGGWGYGMSSVESLAQGLATCTYLNLRYEEFIPDHPFVNVNYDNLAVKLIGLIEDDDYRKEMADRGRKWVVKTHSVNSVIGTLYDYYEEFGII